MNKKKVILSLAINALIFLFVNVDVNLGNANRFIALWSWSIWGYMIYKLVFLLDYLSQNYLQKKYIVLACVNYFLQFMFYILYVYAYVYNLLSLDKGTILFLIFINIFLELLLFFTMKIENNLYGIEEDKLNTDDIKEFIISLLMRRLRYTSNKIREIRIINSVLNIITMIYIFIVPILIQLLVSILDSTNIILMLLSVSICLFLALNFFKYRMCNVSILRYFLDMLFFTTSFIYYIWLYQYIGADGFIKLYPFIILLSPFFLTSYKIAQIYYFGKKP